MIGKRELLEAIWPHVVVEENNLNQAISQLRRALGERPEEQRFIVTEPGRGYRFVAVVGATPSSRPRAAWGEPPDGPPVAIGRRQRLRRLLPGSLLLGAVLLAGIVALGWYLGRSRDAPLPNSIAVMPFENLSPDPDNAFFAAGLHGEILSQLTKIAALNVIGQPSTLRMADWNWGVGRRKSRPCSTSRPCCMRPSSMRTVACGPAAADLRRDGADGLGR